MPTIKSHNEILPNIVQTEPETQHRAHRSRSHCCARQGVFTWFRAAVFLKFILLSLFANIGEAVNPGPLIGVTNPSGALGKAHLLQDMPGHDQFKVWGLTETHLTSPGLTKFRQELSHQADAWRFSPGAMAPPLTSSPGVVGGNATGVGVLTTCPIRALAGKWDDQAWLTGRLHTCAIHVQQSWIKAGIFYGFAKDAHTRAVKERSDQLLSHLTDRIVRQSQGYRLICGDFNQTPQDLAQFEIWRSYGFQEIQSVAQSKWGQTPQATCKKKTIKDHIWLSPELIQKLEKVVVDDTYFADHALVYGVFSDFGPFKPLPMWRKPKALPWEDVDATFEEESCSCQPAAYAEIFHQMETMVDSHLKNKGFPALVDLQKGRGITTSPAWIKHPITPVKPSRSGEFEIQYLGEHYQHTKWCRQLRRLQSCCALLRSPKTTPEVDHHKRTLWRSIENATGFPGGFAHAWKHRSHQTFGTPVVLPKHVPDLATVEAIFRDFQLEFRSLERTLNLQRQHAAKERRAKDGNIIYKDVARERSLPVQTVVTTAVATVTEVKDDGLTLSYEPLVFECNTEVETSLGPLQVLEHQPGSLSLHETSLVEVGDTITQPKIVGDLHDVFAEFQKLWKPMWNKHEDTNPAVWEPVVRQLQTTPCPDQEMPLLPITIGEWDSAVKGKKSRTAVGPDGVSKTDLERMPHGLKHDLLRLVNSFDNGTNPWPTAALCGHISSIEKTPQARFPHEFRPITVLTLPYRVWATIRAKECLRWIDKIAPPGLHGNRPDHGTTTIWWQLALEIEAATCEQQHLSGLVTDITKCYNNLARPVVYACARHYGLPFHLVKAWHDAVDQVQRFFIVSGCCSSATPSCTGYPEGDPMSVVAMALINVAMHHIVSHATPAKSLSFVDNWEAVATVVQETEKAYHAMDVFTHSIDLALDKGKTHFWATQSEDRKWLRQQGHAVALHAKDLGAHLNYARKPTNYSVRARIAKTQVFWGQLTRSSAPNQHKLKAIATVAWPRCLHGISISPLGNEHYARLRTQAMTAMRWNLRGASSTLEIGLVLHPRFDPAFHAINDTVMTFRNHCLPDIAFPVLTSLIQKPPRHYDPGPCAVFLSRLQEINWQWQDNGFLLDHEGLTLHLLDSPVQAIRTRLIHAWEQAVGFNMQSRKEFGGLGKVDAAVTRAAHDMLSPDNQGLLRTVLNGTFHTRDKQIYTCKVPTVDCPWCQQPDSVEHRIWLCPEFAHLRQAIPTEVSAYLSRQPECTRLHGWMVESPEDVAFRHALQRIPDLTDCHDVPVSLPDTLHLFVDGGCSDPQTPRLRLATWGVTLALLPDPVFFPVAAGGVPGIIQTSLRAEIYAGLAALKFALKVHRPLYIWTDNTVFRRMQEFLQPDAKRPKRKNTNHDLWDSLFSLLTNAHRRQLFQQVGKVCSHQDLQLFTDPIDRWIIQGNQSVDELVHQARLALPASTIQTCSCLKEAFTFRKSVCDHLHGLITAIGQIAVREKDELNQKIDEQWEEVAAQPAIIPTTPPSFEGLGFPITAPDTHTTWAALLTSWRHGCRSFCRWRTLHQCGSAATSS